MQTLFSQLCFTATDLTSPSHCCLDTSQYCLQTKHLHIKTLLVATMSSEKFCLRWNDFESNINVAFKELRDDKDFFDVTLACDEDQIQAHKVILSACSPFFRNILRRNPHPNPLLYLKGVKFTDLQYVLNFIYHGEVSVGQEELNTFLAVAEELRIKGLTQNSQHESVKTKKESSTSGYTTSSARQPDHDSVFKQTQHIPINQQATKKHIHEDEIQEVIPIKSEPKEHCSATTTQPRVVSDATADQEFFASQAMATNDDSFVYDDTYEDYGEYTTDQYAASGNVEFDKGEFIRAMRYISRPFYTY